MDTPWINSNQGTSHSSVVSLIRVWSGPISRSEVPSIIHGCVFNFKFAGYQRENMQRHTFNLCPQVPPIATRAHCKPVECDTNSNNAWTNVLFTWLQWPVIVYICHIVTWQLENLLGLYAKMYRLFFIYFLIFIVIPTKIFQIVHIWVHISISPKYESKESFEGLKSAIN